MADVMEAVRRPVLAGKNGGTSGVQLTPAEPASRISLRAGADAVAGLSKALGLDLPTRPKTSTSANGRVALWIGPDEWLVIDEKEGDLMAACAGSGTVHSATDVSHRNTAIIVSGAGATRAINASCPQDLSLDVFPVGGCSRTILGKAEVVLYRTGANTFRVECWRSFATFVFGLLAEGSH